MSQLQQKSGQKIIQTIVSNVANMRRERNYLEVRQIAIRRVLRKAEGRLAMSDDDEEVDNLEDVVDSLCTISSDLESYRDHLEAELDKVKRGVETLKKLEGKSGSKEFADYITEDTEISLKNLTQVRSYYDQVIKTVKTLNDSQ